MSPKNGPILYISVTPPNGLCHSPWLQLIRVLRTEAAVLPQAGSRIVKQEVEMSGATQLFAIRYTNLGSVWFQSRTDKNWVACVDMARVVERVAAHSVPED
jgi:hypothetical protein